MARTKDTFTDAILAAARETVTERTRFADPTNKKMFALISPTAASFYYKAWDPILKKQPIITLGAFIPGVFGVVEARAKVSNMALRAKSANRTIATMPLPAAPGKQVTFAQLVELYIAAIQLPTANRPRGVETWKQTENFLNRPVAAWGTMMAEDVTDDDIAVLLRQLADVEGHPVYANKVRIKLSTMFDWARASGRKYVKANPCLLLGQEFVYEGKPKTRVLDADELRAFWRGLDHPDCPGDRPTKLAYKMMLATMLRPSEVLEIKLTDIVDGVVTIPKERVKNRPDEDYQQPLSSLAAEIVAEAISINKGGVYLFERGADHVDLNWLGLLLSRKSSGYTGKAGIVEWLGMEPFTPHDLRRTPATLMGEVLDDDVIVARCLGHTVVRDSEKKKEQAPTVTNKHYNHAKVARMRKKAEALEALADALREIVAGPVTIDAPVKLLTMAQTA